MASSNPLKNWMTQYGESEEEYDSRKQAAFDAVRNKYTPKIEERKKREAEQREKNTYIPAQFGQRMLESQNRRRYENTYVPASLAENALHGETDGEDYLSYSNARLRGEYLARADTASLQAELDALERSIEEERKQYNRAKMRLASYGNNVGTSATRAEQRYIDAYEQKQAQAETLRRDIRDAGALQAEIARQSQQIANEKRYRNTYIPASLAQDAIHRSGSGADFNAYADARLRGEYLARADTAKLQSELDALERSIEQERKQYNRAKLRLASYGNNVGTTAARADQRYIDAYEQKQARAQALRRDISDAESIQKAAEYNALRGRSDFAEKSKPAGTKIATFNLLDPSTWAAGDDKYDFINNIGGYKNTVRGLARSNGAATEYGAYSSLARMTQDEIATYNYIYATEGKEAADEYLDFLEDELNYRQGQAEAALVEGSLLRSVGYSMGAGIRRFGDNIGDMFAGEVSAIRPYEYGTQIARENLADTGAQLPEWMGGASVGQVLFDAAGTAGNMLPSILLSTLTAGAGAAGAAAMGLSAGGGARMQAMREGYTPEQATMYGILVGASESSLQYLLGGMSKLGGKLTGGAAAKAIQNIDHALLRIATSGTIKMAGEGAEEYLQEILDPIYRNLLLGENNQIDLTDSNAVYSFMLGALTAGVMDMPQIVSDGRIRTPSLQNSASAADASSATIPGRNNIDLVPSGNTHTDPASVGSGSISQGLSTNIIPETGEKGNRANGENGVKTEPYAYRDPATGMPMVGERAIAESAPLDVGAATHIKNPYTGRTPVQSQDVQRAEVDIPYEKVADARERMREAATNRGGKSFASTLRSIYKTLLEGRFAGQVEIPGVTFNDAPYIATIHNSVIRKVISDKNMSAEKLSVLENLPSVVANAEYVGSGKTVGKDNHIIRYDYFETRARIDGKRYIVKLDIEAREDSINRVRTYQINNIDLVPIEEALPGTTTRWNLPTETRSVNTILETEEKGNHADAENLKKEKDTPAPFETETAKSGTSGGTMPGENNIDLTPLSNSSPALKLNDIALGALPGPAPGGIHQQEQGLFNNTIPETGEKGNRADVRSRQEAALEGAARELATTLEGATKHRYAVQEGANGGAELQARGKTIRLDAVEATALAEAYEGGMDAVEYALAFHAVYEQARQGKELSQIKGTGIGRSFSKPDIRAAYSAGQLANQRAAALDPNSEFKAGVTMLPDAQLSREQEAQLNVLDAICRKYGVSAIVDDALYLDESGKTRGNVNAAYNGNTNRIHINLNALGDAYLAVGVHELTHYVKANNAAGYSTLEGFVLDALRSMGEDVDALVRYQMDQFGYSEAIAREEVVANTIPAILNDETYVKRLIEADRTLAERIRDFLREFIDTIKETLRTLEGEASWKQMQSIRQDTELLSTIADLFDVALGETQNQRSKTPIHGERFSIKYDVNNRPFVVVEENILDGVPKKNWVKTVKENLKAKFPDGVTVGRNKISINQTSRREMTFSKYMQWALKNDRPAYADKLRATDNADELLRASRDYVNEALLHPRNDRIREFARGNVLLRVGSNDYTASVIVGTYESGQMLLYDVISLMPTTITERQNAKDTATKQRKGEVGRSAVSTATVLQSDTSVNRSIRKNVQEDAKDIYDRQINLSAQDVEAISEQEGARATELTGKRKAYKRRHERAFIENVAKALGIPGTAKGELRKMLSELGDRVIATGQLSEADKTAMFEACYKAAREYDNSLVEQYGPLKEYLRNKAIRSTDLTSEQRSAAWGKLRMNGNGAPLANVYDDLLAEFPGVFDNALTSPEDQFAEILNKYDSIKTREYTLDEFHGENAPAVKAEMRADFEEALFQLRRKLNLADRSETALHTKRQERLRAAAEAENVQTVEKALSEIKEKQKALDRVMRKLELTEGDRSLMDAVFKGGITLGELQSRSNFDELKAYYDARAEVENRQKIIDEYNKKRRERLRNDAMHAIENSDRWKDKRIGGLYERETQERNIRDITGSEQDAERIIAGYIQPVHKNEAKRTRYINDMNARLLALKRNKNGKPVGLNKWESKATQLIGEAADYRERLAEIEKRRMGNSKEAKLIRKGLDLVGTEYAELFEKHGKEIDLAACEAALPEVREIYDQVFRDMNDALVRNGYPKVEYRKNYFPHFIGREYDSEGQKIAKAFGFNLTNMELPTDIAGLTSAFRPGKTWFNNALERMGVKTEFDLYGGFDSYIRGATDVIFHTDDIQRLRALDNAIRYKYSDEGRRARMKELMDNENITPEERAEQINALYTDEKGNSMTTHLSGYVSNLTEYTNLLANKKSLQDRGAEKRWGRKIYSLANWLQNRYSANAIAGNLGVSISNFIPITQATSEVGNATLLRAMRDTVRSFAKDDGFSEQSAFLTNRRGTDVLSKDWIMKANDKLSIPFEGVDRFASETLVRAKFAQNLKAGMSAEAAIENADAWAAGLMADRSKGALPTIFGSKSPLAKAFTMFQVEGNNQLSYMFKDVPRDMKEKGIAAIVGALFKMFLAAWMYNELDEQLTGRRRALDPLHMVAEAIGVDWKTEHIIPRITGTKTADEAPLFTYTPQSLVGAAEDLYKGIVDQTPFFGSFLGGDGGRSPAAAAMPDIWRIAKTLWNEDADGAYKGAVVWDELKKPLFYTLPPFAGGQVKKAAEGFATVHKGGSYKKDKEGNDLLRFRTDQKGLDYAQAILFGPWALPEGRENIAQGFPTLSAAHTAAYKNAVASGVDGAHFLVLLDRYKALEPIKNEAGKTEQSTKQQFREMLFRDSSLTNEQKTQMDRDLLCTEGQSPADYSSKSRFELSNHSPSAYERFEENIAGGMSEEEAFRLEDWANRFADIQSYTDERGNYVGPQEQKRRMLFADETLTADEKEQIDRALIMGDGENARPADYSAKAMFDLFMQSESGYDNVIGATRKGIPEALALKVETWRQNQIARDNFSKDGYVDYMRGLGMSTSQINIILAETNKSWKPIE